MESKSMVDDTRTLPTPATTDDNAAEQSLRRTRAIRTSMPRSVNDFVEYRF